MRSLSVESTRRNPALAKIGRIPDRGDRAIAWIEQLVITRGPDTGKRMVLRSWQREIIKGILRTDQGRRIVRRCLISCGRKNGKTQLIAALALLFLAGPEAVSRGQVVSAAADRAQAALIYAEIAAFVGADTLLDLADRVLLRSFHKDARDVVTGSEYRALAAVAERVHGLGPTLWIADELAQWQSRDVLDALMTAQGAVAEPLGIVISTTSPDPHHVMSEWRTEAEAVLAGAHVDPSFLPFIWSADPALPWDSDTAMLAANPAAGDFLSLAELRDARDQARRIPARQASYELLRLNRPVSADARFIAAADWLACCRPFDVGELHGSRAIGGLDLSATSDLTAFALFFHTTGHVMVWGFLPELQVDQKERSDRVPYRQWIDAGHVIATPGRAIDRRFVAARIAALIAPYECDVIAADRWMLAAFEQDADAAGLTVQLEPFGQGFVSMAPAVVAFETAVLNGTLIADSPLLTWAVSNAHVLTDPAGNRKISKEYAASGRRVDPLIAAIMAIGLAARTPEPPELSFGVLAI
jgi:phage terminase large subunit-like protein